MTTLTEAEKQSFAETGCITLPHAVTAQQAEALRETFAGWVEESRSHDTPYGESYDGRARFDVEPGHSAKHPALRRVASPTEIASAYWDVVRNSRMTEMVADLIGPDVRFHHSKINSKLPGTATTVKWHQDFTFDPHSNDDVITALLFMDDVTEENGPLQVVPGTHRGKLYSLWQNGTFTGAIDPDASEVLEAQSETVTGPAGSVCLMHGRLAHASAANSSQAPRTLFISVFAAADAIPLAPNPVPSQHMGEIVHGKEPGRVRSVPFEMELPEFPKGASFFAQQAAQTSQTKSGHPV
ncbi:MAG: phytanoyl-CoA dioxygenase family protein [Pseudomonadota bacterium]